LQNIKEHALITIMSNVTIGFASGSDASNMIQAAKKFYDFDLSAGLAILMVMCTQLLGYLGQLCLAFYPALEVQRCCQWLENISSPVLLRCSSYRVCVVLVPWSYLHRFVVFHVDLLDCAK
jgi:hypothetical protein